MVLMRTSRAIMHSMETINNEGPEAESYLNDFDLNHLIEDEQMARSRACHGGVPHHHQMHIRNANLMNGNGSNGAHAHVMSQNEPEVILGPGALPSATHSGMTVFSNTSAPAGMPSRHQLISMNMKMMSPSTPPTTPPEGSPNHCGMPQSPGFVAAPSQAQTPPALQVDQDGSRGHMMEEGSVWHGIHPQHRYAGNQGEPIDLSDPGLEPAWHPTIRKHEYHSNHSMAGMESPHHHHAGHPHHSRMQCRSQNPEEQQFTHLIPDEQLIVIPVRELNKKLHGYSRDVITKVKQKRRTLKNRGYAQNCRTKRLQQRTQLECKNRELERDFKRIIQDRDRIAHERDRALQALQDGDRIAHERDHYKQKYEVTFRRLQAALSNNNAQSNNQAPMMVDPSVGNTVAGGHHTVINQHSQNHCNGIPTNGTGVGGNSDGRECSMHPAMSPETSSNPASPEPSKCRGNGVMLRHFTNNFEGYSTAIKNI